MTEHNQADEAIQEELNVRVALDTLKDWAAQTGDESFRLLVQHIATRTEALLDRQGGTA